MPDPMSRLLAPKPRSIERDTLSLTLADGRTIDVQRVRDPRARRLKLSVDERGARLTVPLRASLVSGERFLAGHRDWLAQQLEHTTAELPALERDVTPLLPLRDGELPVVWHQDRCARVQREGDVLVFGAPARATPAALQRALRDFYEGEARADVGRWLPTYLAGLPRPPRRVLFKIMTSQWGSLAPDASVALDLSLVLARPAAFEYVLVHELCHLIHPDHSRRFWREVEARCPDWHGERSYFRTEGRRLKARLRALLAARPPTAR
ncbi:MAG: M48 family metallopeptidase [Lysobacter sp.]|nr:M48 family metallopeptidase [Lysobacter sp.]